MRPAVVLQIMRTTFSEFVRTPEALFWTYGFPLVMALVLGISFQAKEKQPVHVGIAARAAIAPFREALQGEPRIRLHEFAASAASRPRATAPTDGPADDAAEVRLALARTDVDLVLDGTPQQPRFWFDPTRPEADLARLLVESTLRRHALAADPLRVEVVEERQPGSRYIDFLIPGLIGLNLLGSGLWGLGYRIVEMRQKKLLKRLMTTPMGRAEFLVGFVASRMLLAIPESIVIVLFGVFAFGVPVLGSWAMVAALILAGAACFGGIGLLVAARPRTLEGVAGLMNLVQLPMWLLGGTFFSVKHFPEWLRPFVDALPLTLFNDALREVMRGGPLTVGLLPLLVLGGLAVAAFAIAVRVFRWT